MSYEGWLTEGLVRMTHDDAIWIRRHGTFDPFTYGGDCMRLDEGTEALGEMTVTQKKNPRGGLERHSVLKAGPAESTTTLVMKKLQYDRKKTDLKFCSWDIDQRAHCGGVDSDDWNQWDEITRYCHGSANERTNPASAYDGDAEEQLVQFPWASLWVEDLYRITGDIAAPFATAVQITDVTSCQPARCPDVCDDQEDCIVVTVTNDDGATPKLSVNLYGGDLDQWGAVVALTSFGINDASQVACLGKLIVIVSEGDASIIVTKDWGVTQRNITTTDMTAHAPIGVDMVNQSFIVVVGSDGYVFGSYDAGTTWETLSAGTATTQDLHRVMIARDNPQVIYAVSEDDDVCIKSENGGKTWYAQAATGTGGGLTALYVVDQRHVLVGTDAGEIFESSNGAQTWTEQTVLDGLASQANTTIADIDGCGCGVLGLVTNNTTDDESFFYRNVDGGADGRWYQPAEYEAVASGDGLVAVTCCGPNHWIGAGGDLAAFNTSFVLLLE